MKTLAKCGDDDPAIIFDWHEAPLEALVALLSRADVARPAWVTLPMSPASFKANILRHVATIHVGARPQVHTMGIMPLTLQECLEVNHRIARCCDDPSLVAAYAAAAPPLAPIATVYFVSDRAQPANAHRAHIAAVAGQGAQVFV